MTFAQEWWIGFCFTAGTLGMIFSAITIGRDALTNKSAAYRAKHPLWYRAELFAWVAIFLSGAIAVYVYGPQYYQLAN